MITRGVGVQAPRLSRPTAAVRDSFLAGEPRVGAVDGLFLHGRFWFSTSGEAVRARHLEVRPAVSATHFVGDDIAVTVHGTAYVIRGGTAEAAAVRPYWEEQYDGSGPEDWTDTPEQARYVRIDADRMYTYCFDRAKLPSLLVPPPPPPPEPQPHS
jgi:hypothetical protein